MSNKLNKKAGGKLQYKIKEIRISKGMSQKELSRKAKVSRTIISGLESGSISVTSTKTLTKIANALEKQVSEIFLG